MQLARYLSVRRVFTGAICLLVMMTLLSCGKSETEVKAEIKAKTAALSGEVEYLKASIDDDKRRISAACEELTTNINLLNMMINSSGVTPQQKSQLQVIMDKAIAAKKALACP